MFSEQSTFNSRQPVSAYLVLDSNDRNDANAVLNNTITVADLQPWNNFRLQKPAPLMDGYAKRLGITEVNFPWFIPNITPRNNTLIISGAGITAGSALITIAPGFYTAPELVVAFNLATVAAGITNPPVLSYSTSQMNFTLTPNVANNNLSVSSSIGGTFSGYIFKSNLLKTMGITFPQFGVAFTNVAPLVGSSTQLLYTAFVDIASSKLNYTSEVKDGSSARKNVGDLVMRLYCADETSASHMTTIGIAGQRPFQIHRQFMTPKYLKQNPSQMLDWVDIGVYDEYGDLVYIPSGSASYPDFQMTLVASEN
jgi:hypothetical protein